MSCTYEGPFTGGTWIDPIIVNPDVTGGTFVNGDFSNITITDNIVVDDAVARKLAEFLCDHIKKCVEFPAEDVAAVFKTCAGYAHVPNTPIPSCKEMTDAITATEDKLNNAINDVKEELTDLITDVATPDVATEVPEVRAATSVVNLPTSIVGVQRDQLLGRPATYLKWGDYLIPAYTPA